MPELTYILGHEGNVITSKGRNLTGHVALLWFTKKQTNNINLSHKNMSFKLKSTLLNDSGSSENTKRKLQLFF